jgi:hypothetical protein
VLTIHTPLTLTVDKPRSYQLLTKHAGVRCSQTAGIITITRPRVHEISTIPYWTIHTLLALMIDKLRVNSSFRVAHPPGGNPEEDRWFLQSFKCYLPEVASVGYWLKICPWVASRVALGTGDPPAPKISAKPKTCYRACNGREKRGRQTLQQPPHLQECLAHKKPPPPPRTTVGPWASAYCRMLGCGGFL